MSDNLRALRRHRPEIFEGLASASSSDRYELVPSKTGHLTVLLRRENGSTLCLSPNHDPLGSARGAIAQLQQPIARGEMLTLSGLGDGYLAALLAKQSPKLFLDMQQPVLVIEPDLDLLRTCLMFHDYTAADSPLAQARFRWFVGPDWAEQLWNEWERDGFLLPPPGISIRQGVDSIAIDKRLAELNVRLMQLDAAWKARIDAHYASFDRAGAFDEDRLASERRVLLLTTRFSTVLQYSTRDSADGLAANGWKTRVLVEDHPWQRMTRLIIRNAIAEFKPHLIFQIDHLRHEHGDLFPAGVPFVCWVQDNLPNLTSRSAGPAVGGNDFVLVPSVERYAAHFAYPPAQCLEFRKLTRVPSRPTSWTSDGPDFAYVSNWSQKPDDFARTMPGELRGVAPAELVEACAREMLGVYERGQSLPTPGDVRRLVDGVIDAQGSRPIDPAARVRVITHLFERLNNCLYRQQGLAWAVEVAERRGLSIHIHGQSWADHPRFARHARGVIAYGPPLEDLTRRARFNLVLEPYVCFAHQRVLDGIVAGGFFMLRDHPSNRQIQDLLNFLEHPQARHLTCTRDADNLPEDLRDKLRALVRSVDEFDAAPGQVDSVAVAVALRRSGFAPTGGELLPRLQECIFSSPAELEERIVALIENPHARAAIVSAQCPFVESRWSYAAGMRTMLGWIAGRVTGASER